MKITLLQAQRRAAAADSHAARTSMLILDSASAAIAPVLGAGGPSSQGHALMVLLAQQLKSMAQAYMLVALITNHTVGQAQAFGKLLVLERCAPNARPVQLSLRFAGICEY